MKNPYINPGLPQEPALPQDTYNQELAQEVSPNDWKNPLPQKCYNLLVIGGGTAGIVAAVEGAKMGAKVALVERSFLGGSCLNVGCIPSKALLQSARVCADIRRAASFGVRGSLELAHFQAEFPVVMKRIRKIRARIGRQSSAERLREAGVDVFFGEAAFVDERTVGVAGLRLSFKKAVIATGARPRVPSIPGLLEAGFLTNETVFNLEELPRRLLVIGGGPLGCEFAQGFQRLGSQVTIVQEKTLFLPEEERDAAQLLSDSFADDGMNIRLDTRVKCISLEGKALRADLQGKDGTDSITVDQILTGTGRAPNVEGLALEKAKIRFNLLSGVEVNDFLQTSNPHVFAAGDVCSTFKFTHAAHAAARIVLENALFSRRKRFSSLVIPWCTFTDPEVAHVGVYVRDARAAGLPIKSYTIPMHQVDRAIVDGEELGFVKIHVRDGTDTIVGGTIVASHAGEMINEISLAMVSGLGLRQLQKVIHSYPTQAEAVQIAADAYVQALVTGRRKKIRQLWLWCQRRWGF